MQNTKKSALIGLLNRNGSVTFIHLADCVNAAKALSKHYDSEEKIQTLLSAGSLKTVGAVTGRAQKAGANTQGKPAQTVTYSEFSTGAGYADSVCELYLFAAFWHKKQGTDIAPFMPFA